MEETLQLDCDLDHIKEPSEVRWRSSIQPYTVTTPAVQPAKQPEPQAPIFSEAVPEHEHVFVPTFLQRVAIWFAMRVGVSEVNYWKAYTEKRYGNLN